MGKKSRSGSGMKIHSDISESLQTIIWIMYPVSCIRNEHPGSYFRELKILKFFDADPEFGIFLTLGVGSGMEKFGSGINISDPQH
jgi:hypothetical protein